MHEEGTLTRAATREAIAVSAASKRLMELEEVFGISLFVRQAEGMTLTAAGETLLHHARQMLFTVEKMGLELGEHSHGVRGFDARRSSVGRPRYVGVCRYVGQ